MAISFKQLIAPAQVDDVEAAQRRQALAEAMQQRALQGNAPAPGGRVQSRYLPQTALADLAGSLLSSWNLKNANTAAARAKEARAANVDAASKRVALSQPNEQMVSGPGQIMSPLTPEEASADLGRAMGPEGQAAVAKALMERKLTETDPGTIADRDLKRYQVQAGIDDRRLAREQRLAEIEARLQDKALDRASREALQREAMALRGEIAKGNQALQRELGRGRIDAARQKEQDKTDAAMATASASSEAANGLIAQLRDSYDKLDKGGGIVNAAHPWWENVQAWVGRSGVGQTLGSMVGTANQSQRDRIYQTRPLLLAAIKDATGMSAKQLDSNAELKLWLDAASSPERDVGASREALDNIENFIQTKGKAATMRSTPPPPQVGEIVDGHEFLGGDPANPASWRQTQ